MLPFARVAVIGLGLIGSSIARAIREHMPSVGVTGYDADPAVRATAVRIDLCDDVADTAGTAVIDADLVILCVPVGAMGAVAAELADRGTSLLFHLSANLPAVKHDSALLGYAFTQIARNAREAMADRGLLLVTGAARELAAGEVPSLAAGCYLQLTFGDDGPGIPAAILPKIFDPYFSTKPRGVVRGMGLGLALSLAVVRRHGGLVTAASSPGVGTVLTVLLPIAGPARQNAK